MLEKNRVWNADLADVMQIAATIERRKVLAGETQRLAQHHRCHRQPLAMLARVFVAMLHRLRHRQQNGFGLLERVYERFVAQHGAHPRPHHRRMQRLDQKLVGAGGDSDNLVLHALEIGDHQHRNQLRRPPRFHPAA